ncbi:hypothetical protein [Streptomyces sp. NPDC005012]|uniref:hypothetical protein n=1 Tax=Streptomyces sp. NPDC005012 TaxID=3154558 RepID=UPI0033BDFF33
MTSTGRRSRPSRRGVLGAALAVAAGAGLLARPEREAPVPGPDGKAALPEPPAPTPSGASAGPPFQPSFPRSGLVTNEYAFRHPDAPDARVDPHWTVTSGSLFGQGGSGWSGVPDGLSPDPASRLRTGSAVLRVVTRRTNFGDVTVGGRFHLHPPGSTARTPATAWDGGHLLLRYRSPQELYAFSFSRRDGAVAIKRKAPRTGSGEGVYTTLTQATSLFGYETYRHVAAQAVTTASRSVVLRLWVAGRLILQAEDTTPGRLAGPGAVGVRGDNTELLFQNFSAVQSGGAAPRSLRAGRMA